MKQLGHYGVALLLYAPVAWSLLARSEASLALVGGALVVALAMTPDCDRALPGIQHRGGTHTVVFALLVGSLVGAAGWVVAARAGPATAQSFARFAFGVGTLAVVSHLLADVITPMGVRPFWPLSDRHFSLRLVLAKNWAANALLFAAGTGATLLAVVTAWTG